VASLSLRALSIGPRRGPLPGFLVLSLTLHLVVLFLYANLAKPDLLVTLKRGEVGFVNLDTMKAAMAANAGRPTKSEAVSAKRGGGKAGRAASATGGPRISQGGARDFFRSSPLGEASPSASSERGASRDLSGLAGAARSGSGTSSQAGRSGYEGGQAGATGFGRETAATGNGAGGPGRERAPDGGGQGGKGAASAIRWNDGSDVRAVVLQPDFELPEELRGKGIRAEVVVAVTVDAEGRVLSPVVTASSGSGPLDRAVVDTVRRIQFRAVQGARVSYGTIRYTFRY